MKRILFVDDEPRVLEGLQRMLRPQRQFWEMAFANGGAAALAMLETRGFDIIVTDMRMPEMDGAELLERVRARFPGVVRIALSGYFNPAAALRAAPVAHQFLIKPCSPERLCSAIERACSLGAILKDEAIRRAVSSMGEMPCLPRTYARLVEALEEPDAAVQQVAKIVEQDVGVSAKVLQLVNSAFFGLVQEIATVPMAVSYLGLDVLKQLVLSIEIFRTFRSNHHMESFCLAELESHSQFTAALAARLPVPKDLVSLGVISALLHDVGELVLAIRIRDRYELALRTSFKEQRPLYAVEEEVIGASHAEIGAYLLGLWGLPGPIVDAVCYHHHPRRMEASPRRELGPLAVVHVADVLAREYWGPSAGTASGMKPALDLEYLRTLGVADQVPAWRTLAEQMAQGWTASRT